MTSRRHHPVLTLSLFGFAIVSGLVIALIALFNLHILVGLTEGYGAGPTEVWDFSPLLALADVVLLVGGPLLGLLAARRISRSSGSSPR